MLRGAGEGAAVGHRAEQCLGMLHIGGVSGMRRGLSPTIPDRWNPSKAGCVQGPPLLRNSSRCVSPFPESSRGGGRTAGGGGAQGTASDPAPLCRRG